MRYDNQASKSESYYPFVTLLVAILLGLLGTFIFALGAGNGTLRAESVASTGVIIAGSALLVGALIGFLFGIPRAAREGEFVRVPSGVGERGADGAGRGTAYGPNTNLEQISDWLTKILVGVSLIQLKEIGSSMQRLISYLAPAMGNSPGSGPFVLGLLVYYVACGFLGGYLWTRLFLPGQLRDADLKALIEQQVQESVRTQADLDAAALSLADRCLNPTTGAEPPREGDLMAAIEAASPMAKVTIFRMASDFRERAFVGQEEPGKAARTIPIFHALAAADKERRFHRNYAELAWALKDRPDPNWREAEEALCKAIEMRDRLQVPGWEYYELDRAICRIAQDPAFRKGQPSEAATKAKISADLRKGAQVWLHAPDGDPLKEAQRAHWEAFVDRWKQINGINEF